MLYDDKVGNNWQDWAESNPGGLEYVRSVIQEKGVVCTSDFDTPTISTGWGDVKQEKLALQRMFSSGELMVSFREKFRRYYDLRENVLPEWDDADALSQPDALEALILKAVHALGIAREDWIAPYYYLYKTGLADELTRLVNEGKLNRVQVEGWDERVFVHPDQMVLLAEAESGALTPSVTTLLSPFDPLCADRDRMQTLFDFDYRIEIYTPVKDRVYGYFNMPILHNGRLVGRLDPKVHRRQKRMEIKSIHLEPGVEIDDALVLGLKDTLARFSAWHGMTSLEIVETHPETLLETLR